jgi:receptor protein-tyrosine kinase
MSSIERYVDKLGNTKLGKAQGEKSGLNQGPSETTLNAFEKDFDSTDQQSFGNGSNVTKHVVDIDYKRLDESGMLTPENMQGQLADEYRAIKRPILKNAFGGGAAEVEHGNLIMVTSSLPGEGKTFTAINLAISMAAEMDQTVLLVEADVAKPAVCRYCGIPEPKHGMVDYLLNRRLELSDILLRTNIPKLSILPAGRQHPASAELLGSRAMRDLMTQLSTRYPDRVVIFDSPPLLLTNEAVTLSSMMGQVLLVIEAARTQQNTVKQAVDLLDTDQVIGVVLNKNRTSEGAGYGYYGGYGYGGVREE